MSTEEDGVDEAGQTTQPPLIMAPPSLKADPDFSDATAAAEAEDTAEAGASTAVPLPADTIGRAKSRPAGPSGAEPAD